MVGVKVKVRLDYSVNEVDLHVTKQCSGHCGYCYVDQCGESNELFKALPRYGDTDTLKQIIQNIKTAANAKVLVFVGGDPCEHPDLVELLRYAKEQDGMDIAVLSNTHDYRRNGKIVPIEEIVPYVSELDFTLHGIGVKHDFFNGNLGAYDHGMNQLKRFMHARNADQAVAMVLNFVPETLCNIGEMVRGVVKELNMDPERDYFMVQRIAPIGRARENYDVWKIEREMLAKALRAFRRIHQDTGFEMKLDAVDAFPWCAVLAEFHNMLHKGGCQWGRPGGVLSVVQDGGIQRCALSERILGNMLDLKTQDDFAEFMQNPTLEAFRNRRHLDEKCRKCEYLELCGGGCVIAAGNGDPYKTDIVTVGHDYLAD